MWNPSVLRTGIGFLRGHPDREKLFSSNAAWTFGAGLYTAVWPNYVPDLARGAAEIGDVTALMFGTMAAMLLTWGLASLAPLAFLAAPTWEALVPRVPLYGIFLGC